MAGAGRAGGELPAGARLRGRRAEPHQARWTRRRSGVAAAEPLRRVGEPGAYQARPRGRGRSVPRRRGGAGPWRERSVGSAVGRAAPARGRAWEDARATTSGGVAGAGFPTKRGGRRTKATPSWPLAGVGTAGDLIRSPGPAEPGDRAKRHKGRDEDRIMGLGTREPTKREPTESTDCTRAEGRAEGLQAVTWRGGQGTPTPSGPRAAWRGGSGPRRLRPLVPAPRFRPPSLATPSHSPRSPAFRGFAHSLCSNEMTA
ncbi:uncharacterized protein LOC126941674 [Macaca thibetana thibetana]|uniref:uncharacterized protein LOC126941674 n=1 Tax=Macaca thibetana thibetana TaxID=257877 RepID=UPI0021BC37BF|nr:uncharacterized protein LOC126941674 [Macaca thibetana thibetana]